MKGIANFTAGVLLVLASLELGFSSSALAQQTRPINTAKPTEKDKEEKPEVPLETKLSNISQNCATIKQSLRQLQRADSRTRVYLGASFETVSGRFIIPLNLRLARNNRSDVALSDLENQFKNAQSNFRTAYTDYMRELEGLISIDCQAQPDEFYSRLIETRTRRKNLNEISLSLTSLVHDQIELVTKFKETL